MSSSITATPAKNKKTTGIGRAVKSKTKQSSTNAVTPAATPTEMKKTKRAYRRRKHLHHDLIIEQILTKLPVNVLLRSSAVSKSWYESIHNDNKRLTDTHFLQSQKKPNLLFNLLNVRHSVTNAGEVRSGSHFFKLASRPSSIHRHYLRLQRFRRYPVHLSTKELVGYCNGFPCIAQSDGKYKADYIILQVYRSETMFITCTPIVNQRKNNARTICHGFGFDSLANEYKLVSVYRTSQKELNFIVFTLGTKSWRDVTSASTPISVHGLPITWVRAATGRDKQAIFCSNTGGGCFVWKMLVTVGGGADGNNNNEMEMLLLFNLHDEKFRFIQVLQTKGGEEQKQVLVDYPHLLEFKGYPCIARVEKLVGNNGSDCYNPLRHDRRGSGTCCCCCKVHMYVFKDEVKKVWVKEESLNVCVKPSFYLEAWPFYSRNAPDPCCFCFGSTTTPPTRIFSSSDQIFLYWFDGRYLHVFDLHSKKLLLASPDIGFDDRLFKTKMKEPSHTSDAGGDDNIYCSSMDYQLHYQGENFLSLQSFVPEGVGSNDILLTRK